MYLYKRGRRWWLGGVASDGKKLQEPTGCTDKKAAEAYQRRRERESADPAHYAASQETIADACDRFLTELDAKRDVPAGTRNMYECKTSHVNRLLGHHQLTTLTHAVVLAGFVEIRRAETTADSTIHKELTALRQVLKSAIRHHRLNIDPKAIVPTISGESEAVERWLTRQELDAVMAHLDPSRAAVLAFAVATSANFAECFNARREDIRPDCVVVRGTKTGTRERVVPRLSVMASLLTYAEAHAEGTSPMLHARWGNMRRDIHRACERAGVEAFSSNDLRRTTASWLVQRGVAYELVAKVMGHASTTMLMKVYGRLPTPGLGSLIEERLSEGLSAVPGLYPTAEKTVDGGDGEDAQRREKIGSG